MAIEYKHVKQLTVEPNEKGNKNSEEADSSIVWDA